MSNLQSNMSLRGDETMKNFDIRCNKHKKYRKESEPVKYVIQNPSHKFKWENLLIDQKNYCQEKDEDSFIAIMGLTLNNQLETQKVLPIP